MREPILEVRNVTKLFGSVIALSGVSACVYPGEVTCLLGDNGAGKSTLIKVLCGVYQPDEGQLLFEGQPVTLNSPREALERGIATVYQDLSLIPLMPVWRNFFLGIEPERRLGPIKQYDIATAKRIVREELGRMGIDVRDPDQPVGTMSGGERQCIAISRAVYFGAKVLILDEPTASLGVKQAGIVLHYIVQAKRRGLGVIFITHNPNHAYPVGDHFIILRRGHVLGDYHKDEVPQQDLINLMAGGEDLIKLQQELADLLDDQPVESQ
ncbi:MAG TPA: ATP-binding cassette domain-containing protein [Anaerolineae bacterium]|nr:ATP-binding cassette domain-containing protein [Anaerolineae bacterium]HOQ99261.1 ATP-binding cassette domain-containing protein [Anaerolineae bacterium]HPL29618.1 ATP-binding cassette domain-containing protein [Anaerolineae bacterium]